MNRLVVFAAAMFLSANLGRSQSLGGEHSSPIKLALRAQQMFPPKIAGAVQEKIYAEAQKRLLTDDNGERSAATLFLADIFYSDIKTGRFVGAPSIIWNGFDEESGNPTFIYNGSNFAYITASGRRIEPRKMDTDGGSIPKLLHSIGNFTPWTYGPAFIIHDWIFVAHKCDHASENDISFEDAAGIMAEAIKTLMEIGFTNVDGHIQKFSKAEDTLYLMNLAVKSSVAQDLWSNKHSVTCR